MAAALSRPGGGQRAVLGQQLGVAGDHSQRRFQVVGQRGDLLAALLFGRPLAAQAGGQLAAQRLHRLQSGVQLADIRVAERRAVQQPGGNLPGCVLQPGRGARQAAGRAPRAQRYGQQLQRGQHQRGQDLKIRQPPAQRRDGIRH